MRPIRGLIWAFTLATPFWALLVAATGVLDG